MNLTFTDRRGFLFGRLPDLDYLTNRSLTGGVTVVVGRAQMGKSWLLTETARRLSSSVPPVLVGYTECMGESSDLFLRATVDLYTRWLSDSTFAQQAKAIWAQQNKDVIGRTGEAIGSIFHSLAKSVNMEAVGPIVEGTFKTLASMNRELATGGIATPRLQSDQALEVLSSVHKISGMPLVLIFDQWEKSPALELESNVLDAFLRHIDEWPPCHIIIGTRPNEKPLKLIEELASHSLGALETYQLPSMHLSSDERAKVIDRLQQQLPAVSQFPAATVFKLLAGYPGTLGRWLSPHNKKIPETIDDLRLVAEDAQAYRFREFDDLMQTLSESERTLAIRLSLVPSAADNNEWTVIGSTLLAGLKTTQLDDLKSKGILEQVRPPRFGHSKRAEAAMNWFERHRLEGVRQECETLISSMAKKINSTKRELLPFVNCLSSLSRVSARIGLADSYLELCDIAKSLQGNLQAINFRRLKQMVADIQHLPFGEDAAGLLSMGLVNACIHAHGKKSLAQRDDLLSNLVRLHALFPMDTGVRNRLSMGLFNMVDQAKDHEELEKRDGALASLQSLWRRFPDDEDVACYLAMAMNNTIAFSKREDRRDRGYELLDELRALAIRHPRQLCIQSQLASSLKSAIIDTHWEQDYERQDGFLKELWTLSLNEPDNPHILETLAERLRFCGDDSERGSHPNIQRHFKLISMLFELCELYPGSLHTLEQLSEALGSCFYSVNKEGFRAEKLLILGRIRSAVQRFPNDEQLRVTLASTLRQLFQSQYEEDRDMQAVLIQELQDLFSLYPADLGIARQIALSNLDDAAR